MRAINQMERVNEWNIQAYNMGYRKESICLQDFTLDFYMRQTWQDPRLAFGEVDLGLPNKISSLTVQIQI